VEGAGDGQILSEAGRPDADLVTDPLRVLILSTRYPDAARPNLGNFVERQVRELAARPVVALEVVAPRARLPWGRAPEGPREEMWRGIRVHRPLYPSLAGLSALRPRLLARAMLPLLRELRPRFPFDLISAEFSWPEGPAAATLGARLGIPVSIKARGMEFEVWRRSRLRHRQLLAAGRSAAGLLAVSGDVRRSMVEAGLPLDEIAIHYPAVDTDLFQPRDRDAAKAALKLSGPVLLTVGNLIPEKQQHLAVEALAHLSGARLVMLGSGGEGTALRRRAAALGVADRLRMAGSIPHALTPNFYAAADAVIHPSAVEGFANVRLEALACGIPLVTTDVGEAGQLVRSRASGRIVAADARAIASAVRQLLSDPPPPAEVREGALEFSWTRATDALERHFRALVEARLFGG
jgi:teichuronic acid biosynthesis glycosyltransferase TuaC